MAIVQLKGPLLLLVPLVMVLLVHIGANTALLLLVFHMRSLLLDRHSCRELLVTVVVVVTVPAPLVVSSVVATAPSASVMAATCRFRLIVDFWGVFGRHNRR